MVIHQGDNTVELRRSGDISVTSGGARVEIHADGNVAAQTAGEVNIYTADGVRLHLAARDVAALSAAQPKPGDPMDDGTIYVGISPDTGKAMYTTLADAPLTMKWKRALDYAAKLDAHGHTDWRVPTKAELNVLWENRDKGALKGTFNVTGSDTAGWYWSSNQGDFGAWDVRFSDGNQVWTSESYASSVRCVR